jgi:hypothetical protein
VVHLWRHRNANVPQRLASPEASKRRCRWTPWAPFYRNHPQRRVKQRSQQVQQRPLIYASRSSREGVANACMESTDLYCPKTGRLKGSASGRRRDRTSTSSLPCWAASTQVDRARGARGPLTLRGADDEGRGLKGSNTQRGLVLFYVWAHWHDSARCLWQRRHVRSALMLVCPSLERGY